MNNIKKIECNKCKNVAIFTKEITPTLNDCIDTKIITDLNEWSKHPLNALFVNNVDNKTKTTQFAKPSFNSSTTKSGDGNNESCLLFKIGNDDKPNPFIQALNTNQQQSTSDNQQPNKNPFVIDKFTFNISEEQKSTSDSQQPNKNQFKINQFVFNISEEQQMESNVNPFKLDDPEKQKELKKNPFIFRVPQQNMFNPFASTQQCNNQ